jgi:DNA-binding IclR family transcriptional regulator
LESGLDESRPASANYHANALARGLALLELLADDTEPKTLVDLHGSTDLPKSTLVRLLAVLAELEYVVRADERPAFRLGHKVVDLAGAYMRGLDLPAIAVRHLSALAAETAQTANLGMLDGVEVVHVAVEESDRPIRFHASRGTRDDAYSTGLGKVLLAGLPEGERARHIVGPLERHTPNTVADVEELASELERVARRGWSLDDEERHLGLRCVAVPVVVDGEWIAAVSVSGPAAEFGRAAQTRFLDLLHATAAALASDPDAAAAMRTMRQTLMEPGQTGV